MIDDTERYDRQIALFGVEGQRRVGQAAVGIVGLGGLGSHMAQQFAYLGVRRYVLVDGDRVSTHSLNRLITATPRDVNALKTDVAERLIRTIAPGADVTNIPQYLDHCDAQRSLEDVTLILAGLDHDAPRLDLTDLASTHRIVYIDAATDTVTADGSLVYGGRVVIAGIGQGCLFCLDLLDQRAIRLAKMTPEARATEAAIYGVPVGELDGTGPSVVTLNGVVASLAATEATVYLAGLRAPQRQLTYRADQGGVRVNIDPPLLPSCPYCARWTMVLKDPSWRVPAG